MTSSQPWYLAPEPLAIIAAMQCKPPVEWTVQTYVLTSDRFAHFTGEAYDQLATIFAEQFRAAFDSEDHGVSVFQQGTAEDVVGALFGDCYGNDQCITFRDRSPEWEAIRANVAAALQQVAALGLSELGEREQLLERLDKGLRRFARAERRA